MDRLEKALQKARELRNTALGTDTQGKSETLGKTVVGGQSEQPIAAAIASSPSRPQMPKIDIDENGLKANRVIARQTRSGDADTFRILRTKVLQSMSKFNMRTIAVTSPNYGDGKSTIAVNLALSLALDVKQTVLLVDLDLRNPNIHNLLNINPNVGLSDYLQRDAPIPNCLVKPDIDRLVILPIKDALENSSEMLGTPKMAHLAHELKTRYNDRIVIYDMPPLLTQSDTIAFLPHVDGVLMVVRDNVTSYDDVKYALSVLGDTRLIGTVLNSGPRKTKARN